MHHLHGKPCWFELITDNLDAASQFYNQLFGWVITPTDSAGFDYRVAQIDDTAVAGLQALPKGVDAPGPSWLIYFAVNDCKAAAKQVARDGGRIFTPPTDVPDTGEFAVLADPQGTVFGILQPERTDPDPDATAFHQERAGHANWVELISVDHQRIWDFYHDLLHWTKAEVMDMGDLGDYQTFAHHGTKIGGMMDMDGPATNYWTPYFGVNDIAVVLKRAVSAGGKVLWGPVPIQGPALIATLADPQGASFCVVGPQS